MPKYNPESDSIDVSEFITRKRCPECDTLVRVEIVATVRNCSDH